MKKIVVVFLALVALATVGGCSSSDNDPTGSLCAPADFGGTWEGTLIIASGGGHEGYPFAVQLTPTGDKLTGNWMAKRIAVDKLHGVADGCTATFDVGNTNCPGWVMKGTMSFAAPGGSPEWSMTGTWCNGMKATGTAALTKVP